MTEMAEMHSRFEGLQCSDKARNPESGQSSPSEGRRADPEPEPEMLDLKRLEARQEESRQALEELQQQLVDIQRHEGQDGPSLKSQLLRNVGQAQLLIDERLKSDLQGHLPSEAPSAEPP